MLRQNWRLSFCVFLPFALYLSCADRCLGCDCPTMAQRRRRADITDEEVDTLWAGPPVLQLPPAVAPGRILSTSTCFELPTRFDQVWHLLEQDMNGARAQLRDQWQGQGNQRNPFAGSVSATSGSGSLEGEGKLMALPQNLSRSCGFLPEGQTLFSMLDQISCRILRDGFGLFCSGKRLLQWLKNEGERRSH